MAAPELRQRHEDALPALRRAPLAVAAAFAVLALGAGLIAMAIDSANRTPAGRAPAEATNTEAAIAPDADFGAVSWTAPAPPAEPTIFRSETPPAAAPEPGAGAAPVILSEGGPAAPRLKPGDAVAPPAAEKAGGDLSSGVVSLATRWLADETDRPPPFFFEGDLAADRAPPPVLAVAYDRDISDGPADFSVKLAKGETFVDALRRAGVRQEDRNAAAFAFGKHYNLRQLRPGQTLKLTIAEPNETLFQSVSRDEPAPAHLLGLEFRADAGKRIMLTRAKDGQFLATLVQSRLTTRVAAINGRIGGSLFVSAKKQGAPDEVVAGLSKMFAYDVDFQRDIFGGDEFEAIFEIAYDESGAVVSAGEILYGRLKWRGRQKEKAYYRFATSDSGGDADYFDASGESARRLLMKTPIDGARLSSGFGTRRHPILGYEKAHKGVDFAAPRGTPVMAAGDGVIERAGPYGSFGNYVRIRHAQGYKTAYAHLNAIRKGVRTGSRVRQGEIIGYVGSTGRSTGPHLHYEVHFKDKAVNPQSLKIATGYELSGKELQRFKEMRDRIDAMRAPSEAEPSDVVADSRDRKKSL